MFTRPLFPLVLIAAFALALAVGTGFVAQTDRAAAAHAEPEAVTSSWMFDFTYERPRAIAVEDENGENQWYWYMPYKVVNDTDQKRLFIPEFTIADNTGRIVTANASVPDEVFQKIKERRNNSLLKSPVDVVGQLLVGEDFAKESVAIWPANPEDVDSFKVFISGISGETATIQNPRTGESVLVRRTLMLSYNTPGNYPTPQNQPVERTDEQWVMR